MQTVSHTLAPPIPTRSSLQALLSLVFTGESSRTAAPAHAHSMAGSDAVFDLVEHTGADRSAAERFISQRFLESFGSIVESFMPRLFTLRTKDGQICGAFGLRSANRKLFLEQYLDLPIEKAIMAQTGGIARRQDIVEVGHFSGTFPGAVRAMICLLTERLHREGFEWVTFTGTASLRNAFNRMGLAPLDIQAADAGRLPAAERASWGSYYEHAPRVLVGNINVGYRALQACASKRLQRQGKGA
jgi:hypothetical protein